MDKPILFYAVRQQANRATGGVLYVPAIVDREDVVTSKRWFVARSIAASSWA